MTKTLAILGRQPKIGLAELESVFGSDKINSFGSNYALVDSDISYQKARNFGSVIKFAQIKQIITRNSSQKLADKIIDEIIVSSEKIDRKINFGISVYDFPIPQANLEKIGLRAKNKLKKLNKSSRLISPKTQALNTAQIINNKLDGRNGIEIVVVADAENIYVTKTIYEQNINSYTARDQARPKRDAYVGMLPPKLAQTIINLASQGNIDINKIVLDPFCGTGVVLQEALLMGYSVLGSDISPKMINYSQENILWLKDKFIKKQYGEVNIELGDATDHKWLKTIDYVASETYLGEPISIMPNPDKLQRLLEGTNQLHIDFLLNLRGQIDTKTRLCLAVPAWRTKRGIKSLPMLDQLKKIGYNLIDFKYAKTSDLIYIRDNQFVGRQLIVLEKQ